MSTTLAKLRSLALDVPPPYAPPCTGTPINLHLDANEGPPSMTFNECAAACSADVVERYPSTARLQLAIADRWGIAPDRVVVTAGGDEAIDRACRVWLCAGRTLVLPTPTFEMIARYARFAGANVATTPWTGASYPIEQVLALVNEQTAMIAVVSPNNPTGSVTTASDLTRLAEAVPHATLLVDCAYGEFADEDLTQAALELPNAIVIRTFSKAFGLAGMRVGYALGSRTNMDAMRAAGSPFPVAGISLATAEHALARDNRVLPTTVSRTRQERERLFTLLAELGAQPRPSQANFVLAEFTDADWVWRALGALGIGVRRFAQGSGLECSLRITCPCRQSNFERLERGLRAALRPEALLLDVNGVFVNVAGGSPGLAGVKKLIPERALLERLARRLPLAIVTGQPRRDCAAFLRRFELASLFQAVVCMEDAPLKPDPAPVRRALQLLGVDAAWMVGDTPDDMIAARAAGVVPLGIAAPGDDASPTTDALTRAGCARMLSSLSELEGLL